MRATSMAGWFGGLGALAAACAAMGALGCGSDEVSQRPDRSTGTGTGTGTGGAGAGGHDGGGIDHLDLPDGVIPVGAATGGGQGGAPASLEHEVIVVDPLDGPKAGIDVLTHDADGEVHQQAITDAAGTATLEIPEGGSVMVLWMAGSERRARSLHDVPSGSAVRVRISVEEAVPPQAQAPLPTTYKHYLWGAPEAAEMVGVEGGCHSDWLQGYELSVQITNAGCSEEPAQDLLFSARDAAGNFLAWALYPDVATKPGGQVDFEVGVVETALHDVQLGLDGVPPGAKMVSHRAEVRVGSTTSRVTKVGTPSAVPGQSVLTLPTIVGARYANNLSAGQGNGSSGSSFQYEVEDAAPIGDTFVDAADYGWISPELPDIEDPARPVASWSIAAPPPVDGCEVRMSWGAGSSTVSFVAIIDPSHAGSVQVPRLPDSLSAWRPGAGATTNAVEVVCSEWASIAGYADVLDAVVPHPVDGEPEVVLTGISFLKAP
ncbi:MAG: hypothetical protein WKG00_18840 [Polyangiaceae bacterium]